MNIAEILKYCPKGTKLYSLVDGEVTLCDVDMDLSYPITVYNKQKNVSQYTEDGRLFANSLGECLLFPSKDQRDWGKFKLPVKKGDIMMLIGEGFPFIANGIITKEGGLEYICGVLKEPNCLQISGLNTSCTLWTDEFCIPASEEAKKELFTKMAEAGYRWNADTLELEKIESKFKIGDVVVDSKHNLYLVAKVSNNNVIVIAIFSPYDILSVYEQIIYFHTNDMTLASITDRNRLFSALVKNGYKYDKEHNSLKKQEFKLFDKVLVRDNNTDSWKADIYLGYDGECKVYHYKCARANYAICIPYEGNEYLLDTTDSPI